MNASFLHEGVGRLAEVEALDDHTVGRKRPDVGRELNQRLVGVGSAETGGAAHRGLVDPECSRHGSGGLVQVEGSGRGARTDATNGDASERGGSALGKQTLGEGNGPFGGDLDVLETRFREKAEVVGLVERARDAAGVELGRLADGGGEGPATDDVRDAEVATGAQYPRHFGEGARLVRDQVQHAVRDHHVHARVVERKRFDVAELEPDVGIAEPLRVLSRPFDHLRGEVHPQHLAGVTDDSPGDERVQPRPCAQIEHGLSRLEPGVLHRQSAAELQVGLRDIPVDVVVGIADHVDFFGAPCIAAAG